MKSPRFVIVLLLLAGCATTQQSSTQRVCNLRKVGELPITLVQGFISVPAVIEGQPVTLLVDTGAQSTAITPEAASRLNLEADRRQRTTILGAGGKMVTQNVLMKFGEIGGLPFRDLSAVVSPLPGRGPAAQQASGLLGAGGMSNFDIEFDVPNRRMAFYDARGCSGDYVPWVGPRASAVARASGGLIFLPVELDGTSLTAMLDSGSNSTAIAETAERQLGIDAAADTKDERGRAVGVDGNVREVRRHRFKLLRIGTVKYTNPVIAIERINLPQADMLLGGDFLRQNRVWVSYTNHRMIIQATGQATQ